MKKLCSFFALLGLSAWALSASAAVLGDPAPKLGLENWLQGGPVELKPGQVTVVEFWATWCPPCRKSIPHLNELFKKYKDQGVAFVGVSNEKPETIKAFIAKMGDTMQYPVALGNKKTYDGYMDAFKMNGIPHAFVVDSDGKFAWQGHPMDGLDAAIEAAAAKLKTSAAGVPEPAKAETKPEVPAVGAPQGAK